MHTLLIWTLSCFICPSVSAGTVLLTVQCCAVWVWFIVLSINRGTCRQLSSAKSWLPERIRHWRVNFWDFYVSFVNLEFEVCSHRVSILTDYWRYRWLNSSRAVKDWQPVNGCESMYHCTVPAGVQITTDGGDMHTSSKPDDQWEQHEARWVLHNTDSLLH